MKKLILSFVVILSLTFTLSAKGEYDQQLRQLTDEIAAYTVGTPDGSFDSCVFEDNMITFTVNPGSNIGKAIIADPFAEDFFENLLAQMFGGNPEQGVRIMDFLVGTRTNFCFKYKLSGNSDYSIKTVWPGEVKTIIQSRRK